MELLTSAQSHSNVMGICHRSCGTNGCSNEFAESIGIFWKFSIVIGGVAEEDFGVSSSLNQFMGVSLENGEPRSLV